MPAQPAWFHRVDEILEILDKLEASYLDRQAIERLFGVRERRARQIMAGLPGLQVGNAFAVDRKALAARLKGIVGSDRFQWEIRRRRRLAEDLDRTWRMVAARKVRIAVRDDVPQGIGKGIELKPGELRIEFQGAEDLAAKLVQLSRAMADDWAAIQRAVEVNPKPLGLR
jgi:hypothetical protein